jgi:hypothetical protein
MVFTIQVKALQGNILTFTVDAYTISDGFVIFTDTRTGEIKHFAISNCEIHEVFV